MQEYIAMEAARKELLSSFDIQEYEHDWSRFEFHDVPWTMWKDGIFIKVFYEKPNSTYGFFIVSAVNKSDNLFITDNEDYVLFKTIWTENYTSHVRYVILPKRQMVNELEGFKNFLGQGKKPFQIMFERGVKNSCSLNHS